jgi:hypothetical protein
MTVIQRAGDLTGKLAGLLLLETAVGDDVVEHLAAIDKLEQHVPVVVCAHDVSHAADVRVVEQADNGGFSGRADFFGVVCPLAVGGALVLVLRLSGYNLDGHLHAVSHRLACAPMGREQSCTYLLARLRVLGQLDLTHATGANGLPQGPRPGAGGGDGGAPLGRGLLHLPRSAIGGYSIDGHGRGCRRVRRISCVASPAGFGTGGRQCRAVCRFAAAHAVVGEVGLLPVTGGDVVEAGLLARVRVVTGAGGRALGAMRAIRGTGLGVWSPGRGVSHHRGT